MKPIDVRDLACPGPVLRLRDLLDSGETELILLVKDELARSNVSRFAQSRNAEVSSQSTDDGSFMVSVIASGETRSGADEARLLECELPPPGPGPLVVQVTSTVMGTGDDELGALLLRSLIKTLIQLERRVNKIVFYNSGVRLCCAGSPVLSDLRALESLGTVILACGTCLNYFSLADQLVVGRVTDMLEIATTLAAAGTVLRP